MRQRQVELQLSLSYNTRPTSIAKFLECTQTVLLNRKNVFVKNEGFVEKIVKGNFSPLFMSFHTID